MTPENAQKAYDITVKMPNVHGAPVQMGNPEEVGVMDVMKPDYGEAVDIYEGEIPVFCHAELHLRLPSKMQNFQS